MHRTQLYLDDDVLAALRMRSRESGVSMSELVRVAVRERYLGDPEKRRQGLLGAIGMWKDRTDLPETDLYLRSLRKDSRWERLNSA